MFYPTLIIKRLIVVKEKKAVYNQEFYSGVNIIRGENGTGKSTIMELLVFSLGAEFNSWNTEQAQCDLTLVEVFLNGRVYTLKRRISGSGKEPMDIFEGPLKNALKNTLNWSRYPSSRSASVESYSQKIFELLNLPQHKTDESQNLTIHQIMRLIYIDQVTQTTQLLNSESQFDRPIIRKAIGEYLLGLDDLHIHSLRQRLIKAKRVFERINGELKAIYQVLGASHELNLLKMEESNIKNKIKELQKDKEKLFDESFDQLELSKKQQCESLQKDIRCLFKDIKEHEIQINNLKSEIEETEFFLESLKYRLSSLKESQIVNDEFDNISFKFCPLCLTKVAESTSPDKCSLCKEDTKSSNLIHSYIQMSDELNFQIKESETLIENYKNKIYTLGLALPQKNEKLELLNIEYRELTQGVSIKESELSKTSTAIGFYQCDLIRIRDKIDLANQVDDLEQRKSSAENSINSLERQIEEQENNRVEREESVFDDIETIAKEFLVGDGGYEQAFKSPDVVSFDFGKDKMFVNGRAKFSASSMVVMKNAIRAGIFFHSILDEKSRFPRCFIMDNIEDKGMAPDRSQNFQRLLVKKCKEYDDDFYQLIFTSSMIDPKLDNSEYVVGPHYYKGMHTLKMDNDNKE